MSPSPRLLVVKALFASVLLGGVTAPAAQAVTFDFQCKFPKLGVQPARLAIAPENPYLGLATDMPLDAVKYGGTFTFNGAFPSGYNAVDGLGVLWDAADRMPGAHQSAVRLRYTQTGGSVVDQRVPLRVNPFEYPGSNSTPWLSATSGEAPAISFSAPGQVKVNFAALELNFRPTRADYTTPVSGLETPTTDVDGQPYTDVDGDPQTFNVPCKLVSTGSTQFGLFDVVPRGPATIPPPGLPSPGAYNQWSFQRTQIQVLWKHSSGGSRLREYIVRYTPGGPAGGIRVPKAYAWWNFADLLPATTYRFAVSAVEINGGETAPVIQELTTLGPPLGPPTTPTAPRIYDNTPTSLRLTWDPSTDDGVVKGYDVYRDGVVVATTENHFATVYHSVDPESEHRYHVVAVDDEGRRSAAGESAVFRGFPAVPAGGRRIDVGCNLPWFSGGTTLDVTVDRPSSVNVGASTGQLPVKVQLRFGPQSMKSLSEIPNLRTIAGASDPTGNALLASVTPPGGTVSGERAPLTVASWTVAADPASGLGTLQATGSLPAQAFDSPGSARIALQQLLLNLRGLDAAGQPVAGSLVTAGGTGDVDGDPNTFNVSCVGQRGQLLTLADISVLGSPQPTTPDPTTPTTPILSGSHAYTAVGSTTMKSLVKGTLNLSGSVTTKVAAGTGVVSGAVALNPASGRLNAEGFLPVTAKIGFSPSGSAAGSLAGGVLKISQRVRVKVMEVKLFGAIPIEAGNSCQSRSLSEVALQSTQPGFDPNVGGTLAGVYKLSDLNGCSGLDGQVSSLTASEGNPITLTVAPKAGS